MREAGPVEDLPWVQLLRSRGTSLPKVLPDDFGGWDDVGAHGMAGLDALALARTNLEVGNV